MSIGRVYYWFPDIPSVVTALVERSVVRMAQVFGQSISDQHGVTTPLMLKRAIRAMWSTSRRIRPRWRCASPAGTTGPAG